MSIESIIVIVVALAVGSIGKAITGFGLPLVAIPVMAVFMGVESAVVIMVLPATVTNIWLMWEHRARSSTIENLWLTLAAGVTGICIGTWLLSRLDDQVLSLMMALWIGVYLGNLAYKGGVRVPYRLGRYLTPPVTMVAGVFQGATGIAGPIIVTYLHALRLPAATQVFMIVLIFMSFGPTQLVAMWGLGLFTEERVWLSLLALIPVAIAMPIGLRIARVINRRVFDMCVVVLLAATGLKLAWDGIVGV